MTIQVEWLIPQRILYTRMLDDITREDLQAYDLELLNRLDSATAQVHNVVDLTGITGQANLRDVMQLQALRHPRGGWGVTIGAFHNPVSRMLTGIVTRIIRTRYRDVRTLTDALILLREVDDTLPNLSDWIEVPPARNDGFV